MNRLNAAAYILTGLTFSGTIMYSMVSNQEILIRKRELEEANKEIARLNCELAKTTDALNTIGFISIVTAGAVTIGPAVLKSIRLS